MPLTSPAVDTLESSTSHSRQALLARRREAARARARLRLKVAVTALAVTMAMAAYGVAGPGGTASRPLSGTGAAETAPTARAGAGAPRLMTPHVATLGPRLLSAARWPLFPRPISGSALVEDPKGPLFGVKDGKVRRFRAADPGRRVALIFDDGPGGQTESVLRELERAGARATFFVIGEEVVRKPEIVKRLHSSGMEIGNHSQSHRPMPRLDRRGQRGEVATTQAEIERVTGRRPQLFRPPEITWNEDTAQALAAEGTLGVLHSVETSDWARPGSQAIARAAAGAKPGDIIALHDAGGDRSQTIAAVGPIVQGLRQKGFEVVSVGDLLAGGERPEATGRSPVGL